jgi:hypothetical protein
MNFKKGDLVCIIFKIHNLSLDKDYEVMEAFNYIDQFICIIDDSDTIIGHFSKQFKISPRSIKKQRLKKLERLKKI